MDSNLQTSPPSSSMGHGPASTQDALPAGLSTSPTISNSDKPSLADQSSESIDHGDESSSPNANSERHPKGKRKRTAAKDKAILEAAYIANPKPDKAARLDIVKRVSLNEKEVQIWFQNRRQNDRRKSRPLSPQEIAALRYGGMQILSSDPLPYDQSDVFEAPSTSPPQITSTPLASPDRGPWLPGRFALAMEACRADHDSGHEAAPTRASLAGAQTPSSQTVAPSVDSSCRLSQSFSSSVGYLANRWNTGSSFSTPSAFTQRGDDSIRLDPFPPPSSASSTASAPVLPPPSAHRQFRLSLSLDGKAEVRSGNSPSPQRPQPPRPSDTLPPVRRPSFQRSHSALPAVSLPPISSLTGPLRSLGSHRHSRSRGRSRDVHAWEFACDAENREDELTAQAENESSGSAIAAISLLRSSSNTGSVLQPNGTKRNAPWSKPASRPNAAKKPKLSRALSSVGRLQSAPQQQRDVVATAAAAAAAAEKLVESKPPVEPKLVDDASDSKKLKVSTLLATSGHDSDKENWSPDEEGNPSQSQRQGGGGGGSRRPLPGSAAAAAAPRNPRRTMGRVLEDVRGPVFLSSANRAQTAPTRRRGGKGGGGGGGLFGELEIFEDTEGAAPPAANGKPAAVEDEVQRFMRGEVSPSKKGDMDCVAGLLSLSQGNWR